MARKQRDPRFSEIHQVTCQCTHCTREKEVMSKKGFWVPGQQTKLADMSDKDFLTMIGV
jgi:hypothetical protein